MSFSIAGTRSRIRHRIHPKRFGRSERGKVGQQSKWAERKAELDNAHTFQFAKTKEKKKSVFAGVKRFFNKARGNR